MLSELKMREEMCDYYSVNNREVYYEVPFMSRVIDMVMFEESKIVTIELKVKDWKKAIDQLKQHTIASHFNYLCMPNNLGESLLSRITECLSANGFGFMLWDVNEKKPIKILEPKESAMTSEYAMNKLADNIKYITRND